MSATPKQRANQTALDVESKVIDRCINDGDTRNADKYWREESCKALLSFSQSQVEEAVAAERKRCNQIAADFALRWRRQLIQMETNFRMYKPEEIAMANGRILQADEIASNIQPYLNPSPEAGKL